MALIGSSAVCFFVAFKCFVNDGHDVLLLDGDGPSLEEYPQGVEMSDTLFLKALEDEKRIFGHGYILAALLSGLDITQ